FCSPITGSTRTPRALSANNAPCFARRNAAVSEDKVCFIVIRPDLPNITRRRKSLAGFLLGLIAATGVWLCTVPPGPGLDPAAAFVEIAVAVWLVADTVGLIAGVVVGVVLLVMHALVLVHLSVLSEPLFLACLVAVLAAMRRVLLASDERSLIIAALGGGLAAA